MSVFVNGLGIVGGFGLGAEALWTALSQATQPPQKASFPLNGERAEVGAYLASTEGLSAHIPSRHLRRTDHFSRLALLAACEALQNAGSPAPSLSDEDKRGMGLVVASGFGATKTSFAYHDTILDFGDSLSSPTYFTHSLHNAALADVSILLGLQGPAATVGQFETSVGSALSTAMTWLDEERAERVLFGVVEEHCEVLAYVRARLHGPAEGGPLAPLDFARQSGAAGEGAAFFVLSKRGSGPVIESAEAFMAAPESIRPISDAALVFGADGEADSGALYARIPAAGRRVYAFSPAFGTMPAGQGFDLAAALVCLERGEVPNRLSSRGGTGVASESRFHILKIDPRGGASSIVARARAKDESA